VEKVELVGYESGVKQNILVGVMNGENDDDDDDEHD